jgi:hypothetical protein
MTGVEKALVILSGEITTPPLSRSARREIGFLIRKLQQGHSLEMPGSTTRTSWCRVGASRF